VQDYDVNKMATRQEMRTYVCGQCHVEYFFKGKEKRLTYPWAKGLKIENILAFYDEDGHRDWVHKESGAPVLKAQHPEFELYNQGIHARSGVSCSDCHMPYMRTGAQKISDHHVRSPLLNINRACQTCHNWPEKELEARVHTIQDRTFELRNRGLDAVIALINDIKAARAAARRTRTWPPPWTCSAAPSSWWTSWRRRTPWASTRPRRPRASSPSPWTWRARGSWRCARRASSPPSSPRTSRPRSAR
jgi:formate-dependent nitrite reductase cytochrome c552 subunit